MLLGGDALAFRLSFLRFTTDSEDGVHSSLKTELSEHRAALGSKFVNILMFLTWCRVHEKSKPWGPSCLIYVVSH